MAKILVTELHVVSGLQFKCLQCGTIIEVIRKGSYHIATGDHCPQCGAYCNVEWATPVEQSQVKMEIEAEASQTRFYNREEEAG